MNGSRILMSSEPHGIVMEGIVSGTPYPGTLMQLVATTAPIGPGLFTWEVYQPGANGDPLPTVVLLEDDLQGFPYSSPYVSGAMCKLYFPLPGEFINMLVAPQTGTSNLDVHTIGDRFIGVSGTGLLTVTATATLSAPFTCMETINLGADQQGWVWCMFNGGNCIS